jgi:Flp pilus assembly pilin Flp
MAFIRLSRDVVVAGVRKFLTQKEAGASLAEYALLLTLITVALVGIVAAFGTKIGAVITNATNAL